MATAAKKSSIVSLHGFTITLPTPGNPLLCWKEQSTTASLTINAVRTQKNSNLRSRTWVDVVVGLGGHRPKAVHRAAFASVGGLTVEDKFAPLLPRGAVNGVKAPVKAVSPSSCRPVRASQPASANTREVDALSKQSKVTPVSARPTNHRATSFAGRHFGCSC